MANPAEDIPRIAPRRRGVIALRLMALGAIGCMYFNPLAGVLGFTITMIAALAIGNRPARCGNCGAELQWSKADYCRVCGASFTFTVD